MSQVREGGTEPLSAARSYRPSQSVMKGAVHPVILVLPRSRNSTGEIVRRQ
jgi:hypothetical protein